MKEQLTIKGLKTWNTYDGGGYQFNLYRNNKKVAFVHNAGDGGEMDIDWFSKEEEKSISEYVKTLPNWENQGFSGEMSVGIFLEELLEEQETEKWLNKQRKKGTLFRLSSDPDSTIRIMKTFDMGKAKESLDRKYPNQYVFV